ncbi:aspartate kinase [Vulcanibacillus modesticaldus]|uniref:Aspartokinase n=1 Tax=Vulcanibacillus modesticaldus TaxID=337097 RepID=A0A1D2YXU9_9BACI|nr:aspartate kinase [Vulcanibacillus modesticaldus]OEG00457.1 aspartate kinase [Vulcanibacillus modesticaldus]
MSQSNGIIVQKFGGSSLTTKEFRQRAIYHIRKQLSQGKKVVVVVSAMGRKGDPYATDTFLQHIKENGNSLKKREMDLLLSCGEIISATTLSSMLSELEIQNIVLTGGQAGIVTNDDFSNAQIKRIRPNRILDELNQGKVVIVTGFQGITESGDITTLGRGGSDTTATALGVALQAEYVDIFTDVIGIMSADPRIVRDAQQLDAVTYEEISNLANQGAKVIHPRAVEIAMEQKIPIRVRSTFSDDEGTLVTSNEHLKKSKQKFNIHDKIVTGITQVPHIAQIKVFAKDGEYDLQLKVFKTMAENQISVDFINVNPLGVVFTVHQDVLDKAIELLRSLGFEPEVRRNCAKISTIGAGMAGVPGVMAHIVEALTANDIQILQSADSHTTIWVLVSEDDMERAVLALHQKFFNTSNHKE